MDAEINDNLIHLIEDKLSGEIENNILFGNVKEAKVNEKLIRAEDEIKRISPPSIRIDRAEYIRSAREECLRILNEPISNEHQYTNFKSTIPADETNEVLIYDVNSGKDELTRTDGLISEEKKGEEKAFRSLMIRTIIAIAIFGAIFLADKLSIKQGKFEYEVIESYIVGNDKFEQLEKFIVTMLNK